MSIITMIEDVEKYSLTMFPIHDKNGKPLYRNGKKSPCFIGHLIPDELYKPEFEHLAITQLIRSPLFKPVLASLRKKYEIKTGPSLATALHSLQVIHDGYPTTSWKDELKSLKDKYQKTVTLTPPTVKVVAT
jgi:hypothetical protein